jgi:hypothetical protein
LQRRRNSSGRNSSTVGGILTPKGSDVENMIEKKAPCI